MLEVNGLNVRYGSVEALRDVSIKVETGGLVAILGANGAGKSTLLRAISGIARTASGTIALGGEPITDLGAGRSCGAAFRMCRRAGGSFPT